MHELPPEPEPRALREVARLREAQRRMAEAARKRAELRAGQPRAHPLEPYEPPGP